MFYINIFFQRREFYEEWQNPEVRELGLNQREGPDNLHLDATSYEDNGDKWYSYAKIYWRLHQNKNFKRIFLLKNSYLFILRESMSGVIGGNINLNNGKNCIFK